MIPHPSSSPGVFGTTRGALEFAWRSLVRQPARAALGILGVAAVGALLFDMLLLSEGLVISMRDLLDRMGFEIRVTATDQLPGQGPDILDGADAAASIAGLPSVRSVITMRTEDATIDRPDGTEMRTSLLGVGGGSRRPWTVLRGQEVSDTGLEVVVNGFTATRLGIEPGATITIRATCARGAEAPPSVNFLVVGIAEFPFDTPGSSETGTTAAGLAAACGTGVDRSADFLIVTSTGDPDQAAADIAALRPDLRPFTNEQALSQMERGGFTYFRQISTVLTTVTLSFAMLLISVLLTVSVNQRLGEVAALRALGFSRRRVVLDVLSESALIVGIGGALSLPLGVLLAAWLDRILKAMPGIPTNLHFFVFQPEALLMHAALLAVTALLAALYPMRIVAGLPIAATLRNEVIG